MKAFPHSFERVPDHPRFAESEGMDLRDYFAAKAMQGFCAEGTIFSTREGEFQSDACAKAAYEWADAMLEARKK